MSTLTASPIRILLVEEDRDLQDTMIDLLNEEGYELRVVPTLEEALAQLEVSTFALVLADLFAGRSPHSFTAAHILRRRAWPIPIGLLTSIESTRESTQQTDFSFVLPMPFEVDNLLLLIAAALNQAFTPEQEQQAQTIKPFLKAIEIGDWKALTWLCTEDITYYPPRQSPPASTRKVVGLKAYHDYVEAVRRNLRGFVFEDVRIYATPKGLAIRYLGAWLGVDDAICRLPGVTLFRFEGERVRQVKAHWSNPQRYRALLQRAQAG